MKYTWEQIEEALAVAGVNPNEIREILGESVNYQGRAEQGVDAAGQEDYEPRAPAERAWANRHEIRVFDPAPETKDGTEKEMDVDVAPENEANNPSVSFNRLRDLMK